VTDPKGEAPRPPAQKPRVLFVCIGNSCRSQMAEAFARAYGQDVLIPASAGLAPAAIIASDTLCAMAEKNIDLRDHFPKGIRQLGRSKFEIAVNMSGAGLPDDIAPRIIEWDVADPISMDYREHCEVRDYIERLVMKLLIDLRRDSSGPRFKGQGSGPL
jgi:arsenate reductase (thioredoxin)